MAAALEVAAEDNRNGIPCSGGAEPGNRRGSFTSEPRSGGDCRYSCGGVDLRRYTPVVGIVAGTVGCFGGMSIAACVAI